MPTPVPAATARLRGLAAGGLSAGTGILAHAHGQGTLPEGNGLLLVAAAGTALGLVAGRTRHLLGLLVGGQVLIHLLLIALTGHHHELVTAPMLAMHAIGTLAVLLVIATAESLGRAILDVLVRLIGSVPAEYRRPSAARVDSSPRTPRALRHLGTVGTRGPPVVV